MTDRIEGGEGSSVWERLRHRKVVQWGVAYVAGAWGLLQGLAYVSATFDWPREVQQLSTIALLVGLPMALVVAWYHGERGERRVGRTELAILTMLFLVGGGLFWHYQRTAETARSTDAPPAATVAATDHSIAVLPFVNMSADKEQEYFADGISEELLNLLAQVPGLRVIARTSSFSFKGKQVEIAEIARRLNVANVLEGSVRRSGDTLRITAQLIRASDSSHLWSQTYDRQMTDVFKVQDEIAGAVVGELKIRLIGKAPKTRVIDPKAYGLFLQAREVGHRGTAEAYEQSIGLYKQALELDSAYTDAWVGLGRAYYDEVDNGVRPAEEGMALARAATDQALARDSEYAPAYALLGSIAMLYDRDPSKAAEHLTHALMLDPSNMESIGAAAFLARRLGRLDLAIAIGEYRLEHDPVNVYAYYDMGLARFYARRLDDATDAFRAALRLAPDVIGAHVFIGVVLLRKGDREAALEEMRQEVDEKWRLTGLAMTYYSLGQRAASDIALAELMEKSKNTFPYGIAAVFAWRSETDLAFEWLEKAVQYKDPALGAVPLHPVFDRLHSDPRWLPLLRKLGLAPEQLAAIKFDVKVPQ